MLRHFIAMAEEEEEKIKIKEEKKNPCTPRD
jgi:hypothetical protein